MDKKDDKKRTATVTPLHTGASGASTGNQYLVQQVEVIPESLLEFIEQEILLIEESAGLSSAKNALESIEANLTAIENTISRMETKLGRRIA